MQDSTDALLGSTFEQKIQDRFIDVNGTFNLRDLGGYSTTHGRRTRNGILFRSDNLSRISQQGLKKLSELNLKTIIDLRSAAEITRRGSFLDHGNTKVNYVNLPLLDLATKSNTAISDPIFLETSYQYMLTQYSHHFARVIKLVADSENTPLLYHCAAGKDRTGLVSMITLGLLGVHKEEIVFDYSLTQQAFPRMLGWLDLHEPEAAREMRKLPPAMLSAEPKVMNSVIDWLIGSFGSYENYGTHIGIDHAQIERLRLRLLE